LVSAVHGARFQHAIVDELVAKLFQRRDCLQESLWGHGYYQFCQRLCVRFTALIISRLKSKEFKPRYPIKEGYLFDTVAKISEHRRVPSFQDVLVFYPA